MDSYAFLLDFFPLVDDIAFQNPVLGRALQERGIALLLEDLPKREQLVQLLELSADLGYVGSDVVDFLTRELTKQ